MDGSTIVAKPMSTIPVLSSVPPSSPTKHAFHPKPSSEAIKPNPHPYPIKTTSTGLLSRSNSTANSTAAYQYYVPQSPVSPSKESHHVQNGASKGDKERRGGRHKYSKSLNSDMRPTPLPVPFGFGSAVGDGTGYGERNVPGSPISSGGGGGTGTGDAVGMDVFGQVANNGVASPRFSRRRLRTGTMPSSTATAFGASITGRDSVDPDPDLDGRRGRTTRTIGSGGGGKVRGMVASFERSASRSGEECVEAHPTGGDAYNPDVHHHQGYGLRRARFRSGSAASDSSISSSSSFSSASSGSLDDSDVGKNAVEIQPVAAFEPDSSQIEAASTSFEDTPKRSQDKPKDEVDEPTMEQLLASTSWDPSSMRTGMGAETPTIDATDGTLNVETVKLRDVYPTTIIPVRGDSGIQIPDMGTLPATFEIGPGSTELNGEEGLGSRLGAGDEEMTVEELLAKLNDKDSGAGGGVRAWERGVGCTVKKVEVCGGEEVRGEEVPGSGRVRTRKGLGLGIKGGEGGLEDLFAPASVKSELVEFGVDPGSAAPNEKEPEATKKDVKGEVKASLAPHLLAPQPTSPTISEKELKIEQEMKETREMVRSLSARVAGVETRIEEMEKVAGELEVRGRRLVEGEGEGDGTCVDGPGALGEESRGRADMEDKEDGKSNGEPTTDHDLAQIPSRPVVQYSVRSVVGVAWSMADRVLEDACSRMAQILSPFSSSSPSPLPYITGTETGTKPRTRSREASRTRRNASRGVPVSSGWHKRSWTCYLLFFGLGACAFVLREVVRRGLRGRSSAGVGVGRRG
ncbi:hypothetical protein AX15_002271 [Amanita polypyramis BW_CC]|nr:hypothetical protein AX15_002271 [Amanita polypyramis BW_CC]